MTTSEQIEAILAGALELPQAARGAYLDEACSGDAALRNEVESLLDYAGAALLDEPVCERYAAAFAEADASELLSPGQELGKYRIESLLGRGGMGEVYRAWHYEMNRVVALKVLPRRFADDARRVARFVREARVAAALNHPGIVTIYGIGQFPLDGSGALHYIACELIEGQTLRARLEAGPMAWPEAVEIAAQVVEALSTAHEAGVVHRDIKPENVMLLARGGRVKVLDFGIAKRFDAAEEGGATTGDLADGAEAGQTVTGLLGTLNYLAPEQARLEKADARTDIFAFGLMLYEMLTGRHPLAEMSPEQKREWLLSERELPELAGELPAALVALVARATRKRPAERFGAAGEMLETLSALRPTSDAPTDKPAKEVRKEFRRRSMNRLLNQFVTRNVADAKTRLPLALVGTIWWHSDIKWGALERALMRRSLRNAAIKAAVFVLIAVLTVGPLVYVTMAWRSVREEWDEKMLRDGSQNGVRQVVFLSERQLVAVSEDGLVRLWDVKEQRMIKEMAEHTGAVASIAVAPDGRLFATASADKTVIVWDAQQLAPIKRLTDHRAPVTGVAFSPDGKYLASAAGTTDARWDTLLWRVSDWEKVRELPLYGADWLPLLFAPHNARLLLSSSKACDVETGQEVKLAAWPGSNAVAFAPDGEQFVVANSEGEAIFGDFARHTLSKPLAIHRDNGRGAAFSPDGKLAATGAEDIALWNAETHELITRWECSSYVWSLAWSPDGKYLVSTHGNGSILLWDVAGRECVGDLNQHSRAVTAVAVAPDGQHVASGGEDRSIIIWDVASNRKELVLPEQPSRINALAYALDGQLLLALDQLGTLICWDVKTRAEQWRKRDLNTPLGIAVSPNGRLVVYGRGIYDSATGALINEYGPKSKVPTEPRLPAFSGDGQRLAASGQRRLYLFDTKTWEPLAQEATGEDTSISLSYDGRWLVTGDVDGAVHIWQTNPLRLWRTGQHKGRVKQVAFTPDGQRIVSVGDDQQVKLWDTRTGEQLRTLGEHPLGVLAVAISADGARIVTGGHDRSVRVYSRYETWMGGRRWDANWIKRGMDRARPWFAP